MKTDNKHYLIVGSGLIGRLLAWRLLLLGHRVDIISRDDKQGTDSAGFAAAAMISPATEAISTEPMVKEIGLTSLALWPQWLAELPEKVFYQNHGTIVVAHAGDQAEMARFTKRAEHTLSPNDFSVLTKQQLQQQEVELAEHFDQALFFKDESCLDNRHLYQLLTTILTESEHCQWQEGEVEKLNTASIEQIAQQYFAHSSTEYAEVIDCRGNGAKHDLTDLRSVRGEVIRVHAPEVNFKHAIRLIHPRYPFYLAPRPNNEYVLGATVIESDDMSPVSVRSGLEMMSALYSLHKGFAEARVLEMSVHCRPAMINNMPTIRRTEWGFQINGFYRHGFLFSPAIISDFLHILNDQPEQINFGDYYHV
ncbi:MAG: FAD-dependent oxidoreductase [Piscirickettsiaceae bacterium]|nr:FAD-dependent oxidoreductase [Piscirickettsiaceae bacterium]